MQRVATSAERPPQIDDDGNQRILLHRARGKVRAALESYMADGAAA